MPKKALLSVILGPLCFLLAITYPYYEESDFALALPLLAIPFGVAAIILGCLKIPSDQRRAIRLSQNGRTAGLLGLIFASMMSIASPGYMEAQIRSKVSRDMNSLRILGNALDKYYIDFWNNYPPSISTLTTKETFDPPIQRLRKDGAAYSVSEIGPFIDQIPLSAFNKALPRYYTLPSIFWMIWYPGPDKKFDITLGAQNKEIDLWIGYGAAMPLWVLNSLYDPTNGTVSQGDIVRWSGGAGVEARASSPKQ